MRLLLVEDEENIAKPLVKGLEKSNYLVDWVEDGETAYKQASVEEYDLILLDLNLPKLDGVQVAEKLRKNEIFTPIIMVTARGQRHNKLEGFSSGADDYITKPFDFLELKARIEAVIRRSKANQQVELSLGEMILDPENGVVTIGKKQIELSQKESQVLDYLIRNKDNYVQTTELIEHVWADSVDIFSETVKTHIKTLRKKVDPSKKYIKTVRGKGYIATDKVS